MGADDLDQKMLEYETKMYRGHQLHQEKLEEAREAMREQLGKAKPVDELRQLEFDKS